VTEPLRAHEGASADEVALVRGARRGDREAFDVLYERYFAAVYAFASRRSAGPAEAEALAERIWLRALAALDDYSGELRLGSWLHALARSEANGPTRRARGEATPAAGRDGSASAPPRGPDRPAPDPAAGPAAARPGGSGSASRRRAAGRRR
jgi:DNA-directed RNA polymerase specialized sigma24 family protein